MKQIPYTLKPVDNFLEKKVAEFKSHPQYLRFLDFYNSLDEVEQKFALGLATSLTVVLPLFFVFTLYLSNSTVSEELDFRHQIAARAQEIIDQNAKANSATRAILSTNFFADQASVNARMSNLLPSLNISPASIQISSFASENLSGNVVRSELDMRFQNLSNQEVMSLLSLLMAREKFRISSVKITKDSKEDNLNGQFHLIHYAEVLLAEEQQ